MIFERRDNYYLSLGLFLLFSFIGFSLFVWGIPDGAYGLGGFGLIMILTALFVTRKSIPKQLLSGAITGAVLGALLAIPTGFLIGQYLAVLFGYLAAAIWGMILAIVLFFAMSKYLKYLPVQVLYVILGLMIVAGGYFGIVKIGRGMGNVYGPIGGTMLIGWTFGMTIGFIVGYRAKSDNPESRVPTEM